MPHYEWALILGACFVLWCIGWVRPRYGISGSALLGYLGLSSIWTWIWVENRYFSINPYDQTALRYFSADSFARSLILLVPLILFSESASFFKLGINAIKAFVVANSLWVIGSFLATGCIVNNSCGGVGNPSIMVGLSVCLLPLVPSLPILGVVSLAVLASKSSVALGLLAIHLAYFFLNKNAYFFAAIMSPIPLVAGYFFIGWKELINSSDRFVIWNYMMPKWATFWNWITGTGWGTYHVISINLQKVEDLRIDHYWDTLHNDWLQMVFECGIIGGILMISTYLNALFKTFVRREFAVTMSILLFGIYMGVNPALHHAIPSLFGAWLFIYALKQPNRSSLCLSS